MSWPPDAGDLAIMRSDGQAAELFLTFPELKTVFAAQINQVFTTVDDTVQITYDNVTLGAYTAILPDMTVLIGSTPGSGDLGSCRARKAATSSVIYIGRTSDVGFANDKYITVIEDWEIWPRHWLVLGADNVFMDQDVPYSDQHTNCDPIPVMGPDAVLELTGASVTHIRSAAGSSVIGSTITGYLWAATGPAAVVITNGSTSQATFQFTQPGTYLIKLTVTAANGKTTTGYRKTVVHDSEHPPVEDFILGSCYGDTGGESGDYEFQVTLYDQASLDLVRPRAKVILWAKYYADLQRVDPWPGGLPGYENILAWGWIAEESIERGADASSVTFTVRAPGYWLSTAQAWSGGLKHKTSPNTWLYYNNPTVDATLFNLLHWRSTVTRVIDVFLTGDDRQASALLTSPGSLLSQVDELAAKIHARAAFNQYGQLYVQIGANHLPVTERAAIPMVQEFTQDDWHEQVTFQQREPACSFLNTSGTSKTTAFLSRAPGRVFGRHGGPESRSNWLVGSQAQLNHMTGAEYAVLNNPLSDIEIPLAMINQAVDIAKRQYVRIVLDASETPRGIGLTGKNLIPKRKEYRYDNENGVLMTSIGCEAEALPAPAVTIIPPSTPNQNIPDYEYGIPNIDPLLPPGSIIYPPFIPGPNDPGPDPSPNCLDTDAGPNTGGILWPDKWQLRSDEPENTAAYIWYPCTLRPGAATNKSTLYIEGSWNIWTGYEWLQDPGNDWWNVYAIDAAGNHLLSGVLSTVSGGGGYQFTKKAVFSPAGALEIAGFKIVIEGGEGGFWGTQGKGFTAVGMEVAFGGYGIHQGELVNSTRARYYREYTYSGGTQQWPNCFPTGRIEYGGANITEIVLEMIDVGWNGNMWLDWDYLIKWYQLNRWHNDLGNEVNPTTITNLGGFKYRFEWASGSTVRSYATEARGVRPVGELQRYHWDVLIHSINGDAPPSYLTSLSISSIWIENVCA